MKRHKWCLIFEDGFRDQFYQLSPKTQRMGFEKIRYLAESDNPYSLEKVLKVKSRGEVRRIRAGNFRIFFEVDEDTNLCQGDSYKGAIRLIEIKDRKDAYRN